MSSTVEQIKERLDIVDIISGYIQLQRAGATVKAPCPFHSERTPSFVVSPVRQSFHCFGCGESGDMFTFIEKIEGVDFKGALKMLAERAGVETQYVRKNESKQEREEEDMMYLAMHKAAEFYHQKLLEHPEVIEYMKERGFSENFLNKFIIGFAPNDWHSLDNFFKVDNVITMTILEKVGMSINGDKGYYDRFRSRIMFPIRDVAGRTVAFSGRVFGDADEKIAKYINSPETKLYSKSKVLYGYDMARQSMRKNDFAIFVEGQMDLVACHQSGYVNTVAISGTALTDTHCKIIGRMTKNIVFALDADDAGIKATRRSSLIALNNGFDTKVVKLPDGTDPADVFLQKDGKEHWRKIIKEAKHVIEFLLDVYKEKYEDDERKFKKRVEEIVIPIIAVIESRIDQEHFIRIVANYIGATESAIAFSVAHVDKSTVFESGTVQQSVQTQTVDYRKRFNPLMTLAVILRMQEDEGKQTIDVRGVKNNMLELVSDADIEEALASVSDADILYFEELYTTDESIRQLVTERMDVLRRITMQSKRLELTKELKKAETVNDEERVKEIQKKIIEIGEIL